MNKNFIPNYLTLCNIFCGFMSILTTSHGYFIWGTVFIILAMLADRYDGIVARKLGVVSEIGHDLDSLCDVVSFGVAPAMLVFEIFVTTEKPSAILTTCSYHNLWNNSCDYRTDKITKHCYANLSNIMFLSNGKQFKN